MLISTDNLIDVTDIFTTSNVSSCSTPAFTAQPSSQTVCAGGSMTFAAAVSGSPTPTYQWEYSTDNGVTWYIANNGVYPDNTVTGATTTSITLSNLAVSTNGTKWRLRATNSCGTAYSTYVTRGVNAYPTFTTQPTDQIACAGSTLTMSAAASNATSYRWQYTTNSAVGPFSNDADGTFANQGTQTGSATNSLVVSNAGYVINQRIYQLIAYNGTCATTSNITSPRVYSAPTLTATNSCAGSTATLTATNTSLTGRYYIRGAGTSLNWSATGSGGYAGYPAIVLSTSTGTTEQFDVIDIGSGMYRIVQAGTTRGVDFGVDPIIVFNIAGASSAANQRYTITPSSSGYNITGIQPSNSYCVRATTGMSAGGYVGRATTGCGTNVSTQQWTLVPVSSSIAWIGPNSYTATGATASATTNGTYTATLTQNSTNCTGTASTTVSCLSNCTTPTTPTATIATQPTCATATGSIIISGLPNTGTYSISRGATVLNASASGSSYTDNNVATGTYTYTVSTAVGCTSAASASVTINAQPSTPAAPTASPTNPSSCTTPTGSISVTAPTGATIQYSIGGAYQSSGSFTGVTPGTYNVTAQNTTGGCISAITQVTVGGTPTPPTTPTASVTTQSTCTSPTGTITVTAPTGANLQYSVGGAYQSGLTFSGLANGNYNVTVKNTTTGCVSNGAYLVNQPVYPATPSASVTTQPTCAVPSGTVDFTGLPATGTWTILESGLTEATGTGTTYTDAGLPPGTYSFSVMNAGGCNSPSAVNVTLNPVTVLTTPTLATGTDATCIANGTLTIGNYNASYTYAVTPSTGASVSGSTVSAPAGNYTVTATDASGCTSQQSGTAAIAAPGTFAAPVLSSTVVNNICPCQSNYASLNSVVTSATPANSVLEWHTAIPASPANLVSAPGNVPSGTYYAHYYNTVTGCYSDASVQVAVNVNACPTIDLTPSIGIDNLNFNTASVGTARDFIVTIAEVNGTATTGPVTFRIPVMSGWDITYSATSGTSAVNSGTANSNSNWSFQASSSYITVTSTNVIPASGSSVIGFHIARKSGVAVNTAQNITVQIMSGAGGDSNSFNNTATTTLTAN